MFPPTLDMIKKLIIYILWTNCMLETFQFIYLIKVKKNDKFNNGKFIMAVTGGWDWYGGEGDSGHD